MMERIVYLDRSLLPTAVRRPTFEHEWIEYATSRPEEVKARLEGATVAITHRVFLSGEDLPPILRLIAVGATGAERIDLTACRARGVHVCNVRSWSDSVSEHVFALALALRRNLLAYHSAVRSGAWSSFPDFSVATEPFGRALRGAALGDYRLRHTGSVGGPDRPGVRDECSGRGTERCSHAAGGSCPLPRSAGAKRSPGRALSPHAGDASPDRTRRACLDEAGCAVDQLCPWRHRR